MVRFLLLFILIVGLIPAPTIHKLYIPVINSPELVTTKLGIAAAHRGMNPIPKGMIYQDWRILLENPMPNNPRLNDFSCDCYPYNHPDCPLDMFSDLALIKDSDEVLLVLNEPEKEYQCVKTFTETIQIYISITNICPACQLTLPNVSEEDYFNGWAYTKAVINGLPDNVNIKFGAFHFYNLDPQPMIDSYCLLMGDDCSIIISEWGYCLTNSNDTRLKDTINLLEADDRIKYHLYFSPYIGGCTDIYNEIQGWTLTLEGLSFYKTIYGE